VGIESGSILDVLELDAASNNGVDNVRALREEAIYTPASVKKRVYIVDEVHMLSNAAFNALLKILEEPPEHLVFILATTELHKVPATILSRCQRFSFKRLSSDAIAQRLNLVAKSEGLTLPPDAAEKLAALADGSMRDGLSLLDQCASDTTVDLQRVLDTVGLAGQQELLRLAAAAVDGNIAKALGILDGLYSDGRDMASLLNELAALMRDLLVFKLSPDSPLMSGGFSRKELSALSKKLTPERLLYCLEVVKEAAFGLSRTVSVKLSVEMCLIRICDERLSDGNAAVLARVAKLEESGQHGVWSAERVVTWGEGDAPERAAPERAAPERAAPERAAPEHTAPEHAAPEHVAPERAVLEHTASELAAPVNEGEGDADASSGRLKAESENLADSEGAEVSPILDIKPSTPNPQSIKQEDSEVAEDTSILNSQPSTPDPQSGGFWQDILELLKSDVPVYALLSDSANVQAELRDNMLIVRAASPFTVNTIESKMFSVPLKEAAGKAIGREVIIRVETGGGAGNESKRERLERLSAFDIIHFE